MTSGYVQVKPIGLPFTCRGVILRKPAGNQDKVRRNLFGSPTKGEINDLVQKENNDQFDKFRCRYKIDNKKNFEPETTTLGENLIEKELRNHEMKLNQRNPITTHSVFRDEIPVADHIRSPSLKQIKSAEATDTLRTFVDTSGVKCSRSGERPKPYTRQQAFVTDFFSKRKTIAGNNSRISDVQSPEEAIELRPHVVQENVSIENNATITSVASIVINNESSSSSSPTHRDEKEQSQEQISLHTITINHSAELV